MAGEQAVSVVTTGAENDLEMVTRIARSMVGRWGISERSGTLSILPAAGDPRVAGVSNALLQRESLDEPEICAAASIPRPPSVSAPIPVPT